MGDRRGRARVADPVPADHHPVSDARRTRLRPSDAAGLLLRQPGPGPAPADHADGRRRVPGDRPACRWPSPGTARRRPRDGPGGLAVAGGPALRRLHRRSLRSRGSAGRSCPAMLDVMEARSAVVVRRLFDDPRFAVPPRLHVRLASGRSLGCCCGSGAPGASRERRSARRRRSRATRRYLAQIGRGAAAAGRRRGRRSGSTPPSTCSLGSSPVAPRTLPAAAIGFAVLGVAVRLLARRDSAAGRANRAARGCRNNVTTEMDLRAVAARRRGARTIRRRAAR